MYLKDAKEALQVYQTLPSDYIPDEKVIVTFTMVIRNHQASELVDVVFDLASRNKSFVMDERILGMLTTHCIKSRDVNAARAILLYAEKNLSKIRIDIVHVTQLLQTFRSKQLMNEAVAVLDRLPALGLRPNSYIFGVLLAGFVDINDIQSGLKVNRLS